MILFVTAELARKHMRAPFWKVKHHILKPFAGPDAEVCWDMVSSAGVLTRRPLRQFQRLLAQERSASFFLAGLDFAIGRRDLVRIHNHLSYHNAIVTLTPGATNQPTTRKLHDTATRTHAQQKSLYDTPLDFTNFPYQLVGLRRSEIMEAKGIDTQFIFPQIGLQDLVRRCGKTLEGGSLTSLDSQFARPNALRTPTSFRQHSFWLSLELDLNKYRKRWGQLPVPGSLRELHSMGSMPDVFYSEFLQSSEKAARH